MSDIKRLNNKMRNLKMKNDKPSTASPKQTNDSVTEDDDQLSRDIQYKTELLWCQDHIRKELDKAGKSDRQKETLIKAYNVLVNPKASMVHKRQAMSQHCGDYRKTMTQEANKSNSQSAQTKVLNIATKELSSGELKGTFIKTRLSKSSDPVADKESTSDFKFDF